MKCFAWLWFALLWIPALGSAAGSVHEYHLNNGLTLLVKEDHRAPVLISSVWYKVGGSYEHNGITGISHALEHMMFRGTQKHPPGELDAIISDHGGEQNAMTGNDMTVYYQRLSSDKLPISFELESDRMRHLLLREKEFSKEIQVVMEERRMRYDDNPQQLTYERFQAAAHVNNPYHHQAIGWMTDLQHMTVQDLRAWYRAWYAPNNAIVIVVGDVKPEQVLALAEKYFGPLKSSPIPALKPRIEVPALGEKYVIVQAPAKLPLIFMGYQTPVLKTLPKKQIWQAYALDVLSAVLGGSDSSRFAESLKRDQQLVSEASAYYNPLERHSDQLVLSAVPASGHSVEQVQAALEHAIQRLKERLVSAKELERVKAQVITQATYQRDSLMTQAMDLGNLVTAGLPWQWADQYVSRISAVTPEQIQAVAKLYLTPERLTVAVLQPTEAIHQAAEKAPASSTTGRQ